MSINIKNKECFKDEEKWNKIEKTGGNTGEFPAGSYLLEPIILAYI